MVGVAQLVERWIVAPVAEGSIPFAHPYDPELLLRRPLQFSGLKFALALCDPIPDPFQIQLRSL